MTHLGTVLQGMGADQRFLAARPSNSFPSLRRETFASPRAADALNSVTRAFFPHEVALRSCNQQLDFNHCRASLGELSFNQIAYGADVGIRIDDLRRKCFVFVIALKGFAAVEFNQQRSELRSGDCLLMSPDTRYHFELGVDHAHLAIGIPSHSLNGGGRSHEAVHNILERGHDAMGGASSLLAFIEYLCSELHEGSPLLGLPAVVAANENCFLQMLKAALFDDDGASHASTILPGFVRRADRFITAHLKEDIGIDDIVAAAGVPARTLYHGFQRFLGESPMRWLRCRRIESARAELLESGHEIAVIDLANQYWIGHSGRFAKMYRELYGESPSETIARARSRI